MTDDAVRRSLDVALAPESLEAIFETMSAWWDEVGEVDMARRFGFETAVIEIAGNIVEHSEGGGADRRFTLELFADASVLSATFRDDGDPPVVDLSSVSMAGEHEESGRGLALASAGVDELSLRRVGDRNVWTLESRRT